MIRFCLTILIITASISKSLCYEGNENNFVFTYTGDIAGCIHGGIKTGATYLGLFDFSASFSTSSLGLWKGGSLFANIQNTHCGMPSANLVGDVQVLDNIENGNHTYLFQLLYRQQIANFWFLAGMHDLNSEFLAGDYSSDFLNSSFGIMPVISINNTVSIFPRTSLALVAGYKVSFLTIKAGVYNGNPGSFDEDPYNLKSSLGTNGSFSIFEAEAEHNLINGLKGKLRAGLAFKSRQLSDNGISANGNYTYYLMADQDIFREKDNDQGLGFMAQLGLASTVHNDYDLFFSLGMNYRGCFPNRNHDVLGLAFAHLSAGRLKTGTGLNGPGYESVFELIYKMHISDHFVVQPCFQHILHPGINTGLSNASAIILRIEISN